ncbi:MAG: ion channel [Actinomycetota bacterium]
MTQTRRHYAVYVPPAIAGVALLPLIYLWATGAAPTALQAVLFVFALAVLAFAFLDMLVRDIRHTYHHSIAWRIIVMAIMVVETILLFAFTYLAVTGIPGELTGMKTLLDAVYFTMTTLLTIGFGDIAAEGQLARGLVLTQMLFTILVLSASVRLLTSLIKDATEKARLGQI